MNTQNTQNELPAEVREAISNFIRRHNIRVHEYSVAKVPLDGCETKRVEELCAALVPLWPKQPSKAEVIHELTARYGPLTKPDQPSADMEKVAKEICGLAELVSKGGGTWIALDTAKVAAILTRFAAEKDELAERYRLTTLKQDAEIAQLSRVAAERLEWHTESRRRAEAELAARKASSDADFELFHAMRMKLTAACGDPYKLSDEALDAIIAERDQLRAEVERLTAHNDRLSRRLLSATSDEASAYINEIADLRAQLAEAQQKGEDWFRDWERAAARAKDYAARLAAAQEDSKRLADAAEEVLESYLIEKRVQGHPCPDNMVRCSELRAAIDAARKEVPHA